MSKSENYQTLLRKLLPPGKLWNFESTSNFALLLLSLADSFSRVDDRALDLLEERDPRTSFELLPDWERICGIVPPVPSSIANRRNAVVAKLLGLGPLTKQFYVNLAETLGYTITIDDINTFNEFKVGISTVGQSLTNNPGGWPWAFSITVPIHTTRHFMVGSGTAGDPLVEFGDTAFEALIRKNIAAHANVIIQYQ